MRRGAQVQRAADVHAPHEGGPLQGGGRPLIVIMIAIITIIIVLMVNTIYNDNDDKLIIITIMIMMIIITVIQDFVDAARGVVREQLMHLTDAHFRLRPRAIVSINTIINYYYVNYRYHCY